MKFLKRTPVRTFLVYPLVILLWEIALGRLDIQVAFLPLMVWGFLQYRLCGLYRAKHGGGGPGPDKPPVRLVSSGPYAWSRNPMYLGHLIFFLGLTLTLKSWLAAGCIVVMALWFHFRVLKDEKNLASHLGKPYIDYQRSVRRWI